MENLIYDFVERIIKEYTIEKTKRFGKNKFAKFIRETVPENIFKTGIVDKESYTVKGSVGQGKWATIPWVAIFDRHITETAQKGEYIVYLLSLDGQTLYLTFNQGCTELQAKYDKSDTIKLLKERVNKIRNTIGSRGFSIEKINLHSLDSRVQMYEEGCIFSKAYNIDNLPDEASLRLDLKKMVDIYKEFVSSKHYETEGNQVKEEVDNNMMDNDLNTILYGPPGTGKTYNTVNYAVALCDNEDIKTVQDRDYSEVLRRYNVLKNEGRIAFTTFHQSYGYEEFIEGIKPIIDGEKNNIGYIIEPGVFKSFCSSARKKTIIAKDDIPDVRNARVWCLLLDGPGVSSLKTRCFTEGTIRIGWNKIPEIITGESEELNDNVRGILLNFQERMKVGDIVVTQRNNKSIDGIGIITGDYQFEKDDVDGWVRKRTVKWLKTGTEIDLTGLNAGIKLDRKTVYPLDRIGAKKILELVEDSAEVIREETKPYVFIIDEINRGNISKVFGELITLIEDTKREGMDEQAAAILPYSGELFSVPSNVYILGTMNTADRSIALMDTALRRRFQFVEMMPDTDVLRKLSADKVEGFDVAIMLEKINERITFLYDREHTIGHAFFIKLKKSPDIETLKSIFLKSVIPLLQEYFYEDYHKIQLILGDNGKTDPSTKFILDEDVKVKKIFNGDVDEIVDLPEKKYTINTDAFGNLDSYKQII